MLDTVIKNGRVVDGSGNPWFKADIGIKGEIIKKIGDLTSIESRKSIDAGGNIISPGFIDPHVHSDLLCTIPDIHKIKVLQGVTTELFGQDGISVAPVSEVTKPIWQKQLSGLNGDIGDWNWLSIDEYLSFLENSDIIGNAAYLVPHGGVRTLVMGFEGREATQEECVKMRELVEKGMRQGAIGISTGLVYPPNVFSNKEELIEICKGAAAYNGCFVVHIRNESIHSLEALEEVIDISRQSGARLHVSHFKIIGHKNRDKFSMALEKMEMARNEGIEVTFDQYPYSAASTVFQAILPPWVHAGGSLKMLERLRDSENRKRIEEDFASNTTFENWVLSCGWENIVITSVMTDQNKPLEGKTMVEIARSREQKPADAAFDLLLEERGNVAMTIHWGYEEDVELGLRHPLQSVGSDGIFGGKPHPRLYGTFPKVLSEYVRKKKILTIEQAVRRMTSAPAQMMRLKNRGLIKESYFADLVIFDPNKIEDKATFDHPLQRPIGIHDVFINGVHTVSQGNYTGTAAGKVIRRD
ncbi:MULTISPECIES: N-acyl-D-amino-acid deacylase family protein [Bacillus]|uniref:Aminoacylase n=2 Tax=Bacillus TaxID=1386 RepID=A0A0M4FIT1_9BACI|nr:MULTISPECIES: D-aminoacylase [Bacillus]ALC82861.1 aminoacylase [Bacillus gobiensis]MBP1081827.1 N-acyl-D-amino-acid deacylase [Bacillus capparidis]MED1096476.1 D-aminoacylase [Bacillus capparidis]